MPKSGQSRVGSLLVPNFCNVWYPAGGKLPDMTAESEKQYQDELNRLHRVFGGGDMTKFPEFKFVDKPPSEE